jgi:hypothetical protein
MTPEWGPRGILHSLDEDRARAVAEARRIVADHELEEALSALRAEVERLDREDEERVLRRASEILAMRSAGGAGDV